VIIIDFLHGRSDLPRRLANVPVQSCAELGALWNNRYAKEHVAIVPGDVMGADRV
jgi:hypothetical protein